MQRAQGFHRTFRELKENQKLRENRIIVLRTLLNSLEMKLAALSSVSVMTRRDFLLFDFICCRSVIPSRDSPRSPAASRANLIRLRIVRSLTLL